MTFNGLGLLAVIVVILAIYLFAHLVEWRTKDRERRHNRLVHRTMMRIGGQQ
jgi:uncharacterized membrane protein YqhA